MKKTLYKIFALAAGLLLALSCVDEPLPVDTPAASGGEGYLTFDFGSAESVQVETRSSVEHKYEMQVHNFYLFVFDSAGAKVVGQYFDSENLCASKDAFTEDNCWYVSNATSDDYDATDGSGKTTGTVRLKISSGTGMKIYMLANLDADMVKISSDLLSSTIATEDDLLKFGVYMNQMIVTRNGYFPMYGVLKGVNIEASEGTSSTTTIYTIKNSNGGDAVLQLKRLDAKIRFVFKKGSRQDAKGQTCESFEPTSWQVCNVPRVTYAMGYEERGISATCGEDLVSVDPTITPSTANYSEYADNFFDTEPLTFEEYPSSDESAFTFYMLENRQKPKKTASAYQDRARRVKVGEAGTTNELNQEVTVNYVVNGKSYERTMRIFDYMNDFSTYVLVTGRVTMKLTGDDAGQNLGAEVTYLIPLGNWSSTISSSGPGDSNDKYDNVNDYNIIRNHSYTYTVTVNSVNNIRVEVDSSNDGSETVAENQPGAYGDVTVAKEEIAVCDAHYVSKTLNFHLKNFFERGNIKPDYNISDQLTWSVKTPFGEGEPRSEGGGTMDVTSGLDYKWVHFRLNKKDDDGKYFTDKRRKYTPRVFESLEVEHDSTTAYPDGNLEDDGGYGLAGFHNDGIMDVQQLVKYMKEQVTKYLKDSTSSDFDKSDDPKISVTVFVDEYYYDKNPLDNQASPTLWKKFVNADDRKLHILCNSNLSKDLESRSTGSVITIQQHSIQCVYNTDESNTDLKTAWGVEDEDEFDGKWAYWSSTSTDNRDNNSQFNGLLNTAKEWELYNSSSSDLFNKDSSWGSYMAIEVNNDTPQLATAYNYLRYSCMTRNRDNNGNGKIDRDELRWYTASVQQLIGLFIGKNLLNHSTQLYNKTPEQMKSGTETDWQQHVISSTYGSSKDSNDPLIIWAEEGISIGDDIETWNHLQNNGSVRCVRNLGYLGDVSDESYSLDKIYDDLIITTSTSDGVRYDASNLNSKALRYYTSKELPMHSETAIENQLYKCFEMSGTSITITNTEPWKDYWENKQTDSGYTGYGIFFKNFNTVVDNYSAEGMLLCPEGWRIPNQLELAVSYYYGGQSGDTFSRTFYSFGPLGSFDKTSSSVTLDSNIKYGFKLKGSTINVSNNEAITSYRCVRDIRVD